ncbi:MAG: M67 family metallopeptidase [Chitinispirillaceae bacterium]|nr:M67 family metallopeptidase [Chitinispirillaceae bacterium]
MNKNMIKIKREVIKEIINYSVKKYPLEGCGYLAGDGIYITKFFPMKNLDESSEHFTMDTVEQFEVLKKIRKEGLKIMAVYHSHPHTPARPSEEDIRLAYDPQISYLIVSLKNYFSEVKSFKIKDKIVEEEQILVED